MLEGNLPFDNKNLTLLFNTIREANYRFTRTISDEAKDLINRMLQPNPLKRISLHEILEHPWFTKNLDPYLFDHKMLYGNDYSIVDPEIKDKVLNLNEDSYCSMNDRKLGKFLFDSLNLKTEINLGFL